MHKEHYYKQGLRVTYKQLGREYSSLMERHAEALLLLEDLQDDKNRNQRVNYISTLLNKNHSNREDIIERWSQVEEVSYDDAFWSLEKLAGF